MCWGEADDFLLDFLLPVDVDRCLRGDCWGDCWGEPCRDPPIPRRVFSGEVGGRPVAMAFDRRRRWGEVEGEGPPDELPPPPPMVCDRCRE